MAARFNYIHSSFTARLCMLTTLRHIYVRVARAGRIDQDDVARLLFRAMNTGANENIGLSFPIRLSVR